MRVRSTITTLPFRYPFTISRGTKTEQPSFLVELEAFGLKGYGEAPAISYYHIPVEQMEADLNAKKQLVEKFAYTDTERYWHYLHHLFPANPFLVCALDIASWDLYGKMKGKSLQQLWKLDAASTPVSDYTLGIDRPEVMVEKMLANPWPIYKVKLGTPDDIGIVEALRARTDARLRVDANAGWTLEQARALLPRLAGLDVELVEQPLDKNDWDGARALFEESVLPLIADESCVGEGDVDRCTGCFHGINIKLTKCGGITPARRMVARARELGLTIMGGSMNESSIGTAALAALGPLFDYADFDGPLLLDGDLGEGLTFVDGRAIPSGEPGLGIRPRNGLFGLRN